MKNRQFANKLDKLLHGCGQHTLRSLQISSKPWNYKFRASLEVTPTRDRWFKYSEFPEMEMPENIKSFEFFSIRYFDDEVLGFLTKIKPLFTNVYFQMLQSSEQETECVRILLTHLLPMVAGIRGICCTNDGVELLEQHFPGTLALAKELHLETMNFLDDNNKPVSILAYLNWLDAPQDFDVHGPRFLKMFTDSNTITAMVNDVRQNFLAATTTSTFVIFLEFDFYKSQFRAEEQTTKNAATNEQLTVRNAIYEMPYGYQIHYVEIMRHPIGANSEAKMREWIEQRAFYEKPYCNYEQQVIWIGGASLTIGHITKNADGVNQAEDEPADDAGDEAGPSTSAKGMKKK